MCNYKVINYNPIYACHKLTFHNCFSKYSVYFTKLKGLHCLIRNNTMFKKTTATIEDHDTKDVKILYSPGFLHNEK